MQFSVIKETFELMDDWEDRYAFLIDLGRNLPKYPDNLRDDAHQVKGCTSRVWMDLSKNADGQLEIVADSDAHIVRGLIAVLLSLYHNKDSAQIAQIDVADEFAALGLDTHLSPNRRNGFFAMVQRVHNFSQA